MIQKARKLTAIACAAAVVIGVTGSAMAQTASPSLGASATVGVTASGGATTGGVTSGVTGLVSGLLSDVTGLISGLGLGGIL